MKLSERIKRVNWGHIAVAAGIGLIAGALVGVAIPGTRYTGLLWGLAAFAVVTGVSFALELFKGKRYEQVNWGHVAVAAGIGLIAGALVGVVVPGTRYAGLLWGLAVFAVITGVSFARELLKGKK